MKKMKPTINPKIILILLVTLFSLTFFGWKYITNQYLPVAPNDNSIIEVRIPENSTGHEVAELLYKNGLIRNDKLFLSYCSQKGLDKQLKAGLYAFSRSQSLPELALQISQGKVKSPSFTIPEGYTVRQIGELLVKKQICTQQQWQEALRVNYSYEFLATGQLGDESRLEGFLFPDTYTIGEKTSAQEIINMMLSNFAAVWNKEYAGQASTMKLTTRNVIVIASLIEREARIPEERKKISGVIYNRLQKGMPLQIDATVLYSLGEHRETVTYKDLEINSPYNTYRNVGLPPGPIASPGRAAIDAAINPEQHSYYYYVAKGDNSHYFSSTYAEHLNAKKKYGL
ncbi:MAG: endolytic transglycosylase MltG [Firmicutes bacterium HGW-Firmicutes-15]|nr:MAG: endolytic transglycosylase MltG [Firmicutes bacterium HGW-Firmicutes-15]